jgi:hypothetical protein
MVEAEVAIDWVDGDDHDCIRPESVFVSVYNGLNLVKREQVTAANNWQHTFTELPKFDAQNNEINYTVVVVSEDLPGGYTASVNGAAITLTHEPEITWFYNNDFESYIFADEDPGWLGKNGSVTDANGNSIVDLVGYCWICEEAGNKFLELSHAGNKSTVFAQYASETDQISGPVKVSFRIRLADGVTLNDSMNVQFRTNETWFAAVMKDKSGNDSLALPDNTYHALSTEWVQVSFVMDGTTLTYQIGANDSKTIDYAVAVNGFEIYKKGKYAFNGLYIDDLKISAY